ncbi:sigma 54-interacting transcriptional regulator [Bacteriovoracaceae bacterium]|nr:sigma 54-interacting transcriptional regulator [Bacteriovoracaceae bacterium]
MVTQTRVELVGCHPKFRKALDFASNVSVTKSPVLIVGEAGTGKKTISLFIHENSQRQNSPIYEVDCSQEAQQVENQILGFRDPESGSFNKGVLELANGGTVIFANIEGLDENFQKRLYQIIQELPDYELDIRLLATTSKNLSKYVGAGRFYRALYTYFSGSQIMITPLRERTNDIEVLSNYFAKAFGNNTSKIIDGFSPEAMTKLTSYYWTHNVAELRAVVEGATEAAATSVISIQDIQLGERKSESIVNDMDENGLKLMSLKEAEKLLIKKALIHTSENRTQAAKILGVSIRTLRNKINEYRGNGTNYFVNLR